MPETVLGNGLSGMGETASEVGVTPRLRSLHTLPEVISHTDIELGHTNSPPALQRETSVAASHDSQRALIRRKVLSSGETSLQRAQNFFGLSKPHKRLFFLAWGVICIIGGAFLAGTKFNTVGSGSSPVSAAYDIANPYLQGVSKTVAYGAAKDAHAALSSSLTASHAKIYIAELKPKYNIELLEATIGLGSESTLIDKASKQEILYRAASSVISNPFGKPLDTSNEELMDTLPNNLDVLFYSQLLKSPLRTSNVSEADVVLVTFWVHKLVRLDKELEKPNKHDLTQIDFWKETKELLPLLGKVPHLLVVPGQEAELRGTCGGHGLNFLCHPGAKDFIVITPEVLTSRVGSLMGSRIAPGIIDSLKNSSNSIAVPDTSIIHFSQSSRSWGAAFDAKAVRVGKTRLLAEAFRARAPLRKALKSQCLQLPAACSHTEPQTSGQPTSKIVLEAFLNDQHAWFSLQPPGDTAVRQSFYDCILAGAIPTIFDHKLYGVLPFTDIINWKSVLTLINAEDIMKSKRNISEILESGHSEEDRLTRLAVLHTMRHLLQYSVTPVHYLVRFDFLTLVTAQDDAFTISLKALLRHICARGLLPHRCP